MKYFILGLCVFYINAVSAQQDGGSWYSNTIHAKELREKLEVLAGPEMQGRETATEGERKAAAFIEEHFKKIGLSPANGSSYRQYWNVYQDSLAGASLSVYGINLALDRHFSVSGGSVNNGNFSAKEVVFAAFGIADSSRNDYDSLDVNNKWVMLIEGAPEDIDNKNPSRWVGQSSTSAKITAAQKRGAIGVLLISRSFPSPRGSAGKGYLYTKKNNTGFNAITISYQAASSILNKPLASLAEAGKLERGVYKTDLQLQVSKQTTTFESSNVLGMVEGTDKKDEYVFMTAHYDHLGMRDGAIYHGADDDGSGTVSIMEMAEAFAQAKKEGRGPRRTVVFMAVSGEEKGLLGSAYYAENAIYPLAKTTVNLNIDMVGRVDPKYKGDSLNYVYVIGDDKLSTELRTITDSINNVNFKMELDRKYTDVTDPNRYYYRSDHYNFAKNGVPVIFYFNGTHADYHRPSDTVDKINFLLMQKRVRFIFQTAWVMANREDMLKRDLKLNIPAR